MSRTKCYLLSVLIFLGACNDDTRSPKLDLTGHWNVDHGISDPCQVNASFTEELLVLTFYSLEEGACQPEQYGIRNNALTIRIDDKQDYFEEDGTLATTLQVSVPEHQAMGTLTLRDTEQGLTGDIVAASDPNNLLEPLLEPLYQLTPLSDHWLPLALGRWGAPCEQWGFPDAPIDQCELIEINSATSGRIKSYGGSGTSGPDGEVHEIQSEWHFVTFALRNHIVREGGGHELSVVMVTDLQAVESIPAIWSLSDDSFTLTVEDVTGIPSEFHLSPVN